MQLPGHLRNERLHGGALTAEGNPIGGTGLSPYRVAHPDETTVLSVERAEEDLVELTDSHPAVRLLAEGATSREAFAEAAQAQGLSFTCAASGGFPGLKVRPVGAVSGGR